LTNFMVPPERGRIASKLIKQALDQLRKPLSTKDFLRKPERCFQDV
jgi:hypothetical protein